MEKKKKIIIIINKTKIIFFFVAYTIKLQYLYINLLNMQLNNK